MVQKEKKKGKGLLWLLLLLGGAGAAIALSSKKSTTTPTTVDTHKVCSGGVCIDGAGAGDNECSDTNPCPVPGSSHKECDGNGKCIIVNGAGADKCSLDGDCPSVGQHKECDANKKCVVVVGAGADTCVDDSTCSPPPATHKVCQGGSCVDFPGAGADECTDNASCNNPPAPCTCLSMTLTQSDNVAVGGKTNVKMLITNNCQNTIQGKLILTDKSNPAQFSPITASKDISISALANSMPFNPTQLTRTASGVATLSVTLTLQDGTVCKELTFLNGTVQGTSCAGHCGEILTDCSCQVGCEAAGNCCSDKATFCTESGTFPRVLIAACSASPDELSEAQQLKGNMIGGSQGGWQDGINIFSAFVSTKENLAQMINDNNPEVIIVVGSKSWENCTFNAWTNWFNPVGFPFDYTDMVQVVNDGGVGVIGLGGYTLLQTKQIVNSFTTFAGYVADEINGTGTGKAPANLLSLKPEWLSCKADCSDTQTLPYCYCGNTCAPGDVNCCFDKEGFCP